MLYFAAHSGFSVFYLFVPVNSLIPIWAFIAGRTFIDTLLEFAQMRVIFDLVTLWCTEVS